MEEVAGSVIRGVRHDSVLRRDSGNMSPVDCNDASPS
jgi:hypothetical protein